MRISERIAVGFALQRSAEAFPDRRFVTSVATDQAVSYGEFDLLVNRLANGLAKLGVSRGQFVNLMLPNGLEYLATSYAIKRLGAIEVAVNCEFQGAGLCRILNLAPSAALITCGQFADRIRQIAPELSTPKAVVVVGGKEALDNIALESAPVLSYEELNLDNADSYPAVKVMDRDPGMVVFTSGTTGPSKGCVVSHRWMVRGAESVVEALKLTGEDTFYTAYPLFHTRAAVLDVFATVLVGGSVVVAPRFSASQFWAQMRRYNVTVFSIIGTVMQILWKQPEDPRDRNHSVRISWGGPISVAPSEFERRFGVKVLPGEGVFGMSETGMVSISSLDPSTSGKVRAVFEVRIGDENDDPVPKTEVGEILVRPTEPGVMFDGYLGMPEETVAAWRNLWFHTGDLGRIDSQDRLIFVGRKRDSIRRAGHNISSWEVEEGINSHPSVQECAVVGVPSALGEEEVAAFVVLRPEALLSAEGLIAHCHAKMAAFMVPQHVSFVCDIPKTPTGKPAKAALAAALQRVRSDS